ncbi:ketosynthase chain-length factor [Amycolatopsis sp. PS_44_ISF1]|uniref:ketosynthase chain-length factor n=1 Tax=Amycolatopsis sp. PS_44_ISF1 TaxID=2974917 RepID=UPI0028DEE17D|nr:ketosynthase chain-length factor [Amycolatopsis sp. PS_44_ISF1]MDT8910108.1 ketosynthase chain-length factor [Amycolatopsis sp. PS_44_ISF1]
MTTAEAAPVVTGIGVVAPNGVGVEEFWANVLAGRSGLAPVTRFDAAGYPVSRVGAVPDEPDARPNRITVQTDRWTRFAMTATEEALRTAGIGPGGERDFDDYDLAVITASSSGGNEFGQREIEQLWRAGPEYVSVYQSIAWFYAATTGQLSIRHGMRGPCGVVVAEQAGGLDALAQGRRMLRTGTKAVVTGGTEAALSPYALVCQSTGGRFTRGEYRPFDTRACGCVPGEGGAILVLEDEGSARARGVSGGYGRVAGYAATFDPRPGSGRPGGLPRAITGALRDAGLRPSDVDVVFADGAGTPAGDAEEAAALTGVFGARGVPVTVPKTMTGRLAAGGAPLDVACALLALRDGVLPPTPGVTEPAHELDLVLEPRTGPARTALVLARGFGGFNSALVLTR